MTIAGHTKLGLSAASGHEERMYYDGAPYIRWYVKRGGGGWMIKGTLVLIHEATDGRIFVGAGVPSEESRFPPRFFPTLEAAVIYLRLAES